MTSHYFTKTTTHLRERAFGNLNRVLKKKYVKLLGKPRQRCIRFQRVKEWIQNFSSQGGVISVLLLHHGFKTTETRWKVIHGERKRARFQTFEFLIAFHMKLTDYTYKSLLLSLKIDRLIDFGLRSAWK